MTTTFQIANIRDQRVGLIGEISSILDNYKTKPVEIPLECENLCGFSVNCRVTVSLSSIRLDIKSKTIHWEVREDECDYEWDTIHYMNFPSKMLFSKHDRIDFQKESNNKKSISINEWYAIVKKNKDLVVLPISSVEIENAVDKLIDVIQEISFDKKYNRFSFAENTPMMKKIVQECTVCYEDTTGITNCKHPLCLPCLEQLQIRCDRHFMTSDCPLCRQEITGY